MEKLLQPERFNVDSNAPNSAKAWTHWYKTFDNFMESLTDPNKLKLLTNFISPDIYAYIMDCTTFEQAINILKNIYVKPKNEIFARHVLAIRYQQQGESMDSYFQELRSLAKDCNFVAVNAATYADESIRDSFISGIQSPLIRQRLLENSTLTLTQAFDQARALDLAQQNSERYVQTQAIQNPQTAYVKPVHSESTLETNDPTMAAVKSSVKS